MCPLSNLVEKEGAGSKSEDPSWVYYCKSVQGAEKQKIALTNAIDIQEVNLKK